MEQLEIFWHVLWNLLSSRTAVIHSPVVLQNRRLLLIQTIRAGGRFAQVPEQTLSMICSSSHKNSCPKSCPPKVTDKVTCPMLARELEQIMHRVCSGTWAKLQTWHMGLPWVAWVTWHDFLGMFLGQFCALESLFVHETKRRCSWMRDLLRRARALRITDRFTV